MQRLTALFLALMLALTPLLAHAESADAQRHDALLDTIYTIALEMNYNVDCFMELIGGETAANVFAMYLADF